MPSITFLNVPAFDATKTPYDSSNIAQIIEFKYTSNGHQAIRNTLRVYDSKTGEMVYENTNNSMALNNTIEAGKLTNGRTYRYSITVYYKDAKEIERSIVFTSLRTFKCISTPKLSFNRPTLGERINDASIDAILKYSQLCEAGEAKEPIKKYRVTVLSPNGSIFWQSKFIFNDEKEKEPLHAHETEYSNEFTVRILGGFEHKTSYCIRAVGETKNGYHLDSGFIPFRVEYKSTMLYQALQLENKEDDGIVRIASNIIDIYGTSNTEELEYIDNEMVDLREDGNWVRFNNGFSLSKDFLIMFTGYGFTQNKEIMYIGNEVTITWRKNIKRIPKYDENGAFKEEERYYYVYAELRIDRGPKYVVFSNHIHLPNDTDMIHFWVCRTNGLYKVKIANKGVVNYVL